MSQKTDSVISATKPSTETELELVHEFYSTFSIFSWHEVTAQFLLHIIWGANKGLRDETLTPNWFTVYHVCSNILVNTIVGITRFENIVFFTWITTVIWWLLGLVIASYPCLGREGLVYTVCACVLIYPTSPKNRILCYSFWVMIMLEFHKPQATLTSTVWGVPAARTFLTASYALGKLQMTSISESQTALLCGGHLWPSKSLYSTRSFLQQAMQFKWISL